MATRKPTTVKRAAPVGPAPAAPRTRRPALRRTKTATPPTLAAAPEIHEIHEIPETLEGHGTPDTAADEQIRVRAYYLHLERRGRPADPTSDWLRAEQELADRATDSPS